MVAAADRRVIGVHAGSEIAGVVAVEMVAVGSEGGIKHPLHAAVFKQHMVQA